jgi:mannose-1-phosphate guanylyltransferase
VHVIRESKPIGTAGTVLANRDFVRGDASFGVFHADNLTDFALDKLVAFHARHDGLLTMGLFRTPTPSEAGVVETTADGRILSFVEKPAVPGSDLANAGVYIARQGLFDAIPADRGVADFGRDVFPGLTGRMFGQVVDGYLKDVGTPSALARARQDWAARAAEASSVTAEPWGAM